MQSNEKMEACQLYIEQQIDESLKKGATPYSIGKDLAAWVEKLFEAKVKPKTIMERARRKKISTNVDSASTIENDTESDGNQTPTPTVAKDGTYRGGVREGAGRPAKYEHKLETLSTGGDETGTNQQYEIKPATEAMQYAIMAITDLEKIRKEDPMRWEALDRVSIWIKQQEQERKEI